MFGAIGKGASRGGVSIEDSDDGEVEGEVEVEVGVEVVTEFVDEGTMASRIKNSERLESERIRLSGKVRWIEVRSSV
jgi:hypothetical protein